MNKNWWVYALAAMIVLQWIVPVQMILQKFQTDRHGTPFLFKIIPVDPVDPLRGRYLALSFDENTFIMEGQEYYSPPRPLFAEIIKGKDGYAKVARLHFDTKPQNTQNYIALSEYYTILSDSNATVHYTLPFSRYYVNEKEAPKLEKEYLAALRDSTRICFARVNVLNGHAVLKDLEIK